jgi:hypothetical protein
MQAYYPIQVALDALLLNVSGITAYNPANGTGNFIAENQTIDLGDVPNTSATVFVRSTLIPVSPETSTVGIGGYDKVSGFYVVDCMGPLDKGYAQTKQLADTVIAAFTRGTIITLSNNEQITIEKTGIAQNVTQGAWNMNKLYALQVRVDWFGYMSAT